ncbi:MAG: hypothetical protein AVDCRST_MAG56-4690, partial [uncultured Cytophagales bacterium]
CGASRPGRTGHAEKGRCAGGWKAAGGYRAAGRNRRWSGPGGGGGKRGIAGIIFR